MAFDPTSWLWMNGRITRWHDATVHVSAHGLHYGTGVFEGIRCYPTEHGPALFRLGAHLERLLASAAVHGIPVPFTADELRAAAFDVVAANGFESCYLRPVCFFGSGSLGLVPAGCPVETAILAWPWDPLLGAEAADHGVNVTLSTWRKFHSTMTPTTAKACGQYVNSVLAAREARARGYDEAILLSSNGAIAEGAGDNVFLVCGRKLVTNDERHSILPGITRDSIITLAGDLGFSVEVRRIGRGELFGANEAFLTGTAVEIAPIRAVDGRPTGTQCPGPVTREIGAAFADAVRGRDARHADWAETREAPEEATAHDAPFASAAAS